MSASTSKSYDMETGSLPASISIKSSMSGDLGLHNLSGLRDSFSSRSDEESGMSTSVTSEDYSSGSTSVGSQESDGGDDIEESGSDNGLSEDDGSFDESMDSRDRPSSGIDIEAFSSRSKSGSRSFHSVHSTNDDSITKSAHSNHSRYSQSTHSNKSHTDQRLVFESSLEQVENPAPLDLSQMDMADRADESSGDETDTCKLSIEEHIVRRLAKEDPSPHENDHSRRTVENQIAQKFRKGQGLSGEETDSCQLSIDEHMARRLFKWKQHKKSMAGVSESRAMSQHDGHSISDSTIETNAYTTNDDGTLDGSFAASMNTWSVGGQSTATDESSLERVKIIGRVPKQRISRSLMSAPSDGLESAYKSGDPLSPVQETVSSGENSMGRLEHVEYMSRMEIASNNRDLSTVESLGKNHARAAFISMQKKSVDDGDQLANSVPLEIKTRVFSEEEEEECSVRGLPFNGMILAAPPVRQEQKNSKCDTLDVELGTMMSTSSDPKVVGKKNAVKQNDLVGVRSDLELFFVTLISLSLVVMVILLIFIIAKGS
uniref:Uncharacterized protein n=1 Tax=Entomoneis paludosa TaxID=265537 RepID=A0A7S2VFB2_9STRA|mmetsp:Transcript_18101/g.37404  ORF Transcript_18101/g.37404 Transcript_18101/m.37404 type:complete len:545 (+) Transcript_18101:2-1636(+)